MSRIAMRVHHVIWTTYNARRPKELWMIRPSVALRLTAEQEVIVAHSLRATIRRCGLSVLALNICQDHVHMAMRCDESRIPRFVNLLKGRSSRDLRLAVPELVATLPRCWAREYHARTLHSQAEIASVLSYIRTNRTHHKLPGNPALDLLMW